MDGTAVFIFLAPVLVPLIAAFALSHGAVLADLTLAVGFFCAGCLNIRNAAVPTNSSTRINAICISLT